MIHIPIFFLLHYGKIGEPLPMLRLTISVLFHFISILFCLNCLFRIFSWVASALRRYKAGLSATKLVLSRIQEMQGAYPAIVQAHNDLKSQSS
jgi:hypothetical protein